MSTKERNNSFTIISRAFSKRHGPLEPFPRQTPQQTSGPVTECHCLQAILPRILGHILLRLVLQGHVVTSPKANVMEVGTDCYKLKWKKKGGKKFNMFNLYFLEFSKKNPAGCSKSV